MGDIVDWKTKKDVPVEQAEDPRRVPPPPADGLVLACACGGTLHELLNAGVVRCGRCGRHGTVSWRWNPDKGSPQPKQPRGTPPGHSA